MIKRKMLTGVLMIALLVSCISPVEIVRATEIENSVKSGEADENGFVIDEDGVLTDYVGVGEDITIPDNVTNIGDYAFASCMTVKSVIIPESVKSIGEWAFWNDFNLVSVTFPDGISIGTGAFSNCDSLTDITIPKGVLYIGLYAFEQCNSLSSIEVSAENPNYVSENGILYNKDKSILLQCPAGKAGEIEIPQSVTKIQNNAFAGCRQLTNVILSNQITEIGSYAFTGCVNLEEVLIPASVVNIDVGIFADCSNLIEIKVAEDNANFETENGILYSKGKDTLMQCPGGKMGQVIISESVTRIRISAFSGCIGITDVKIPQEIKKIEYAAFSGCVSLKSVVIPENVTGIENWAFGNCSSLSKATIYENVTNIGAYAFHEVSDDFIITCVKDSYVEQYAKENNIKYEYLAQEKKNQNITASDFEKTFGDAAFFLNATTDGGGTLSYLSDNTSVVTVDNNGQVTLVGAGIAHITITASATDVYKTAEKVITITVKAPEVSTTPEQPTDQEQPAPSEQPTTPEQSATSETLEKKEQTIIAKNITKTYGAKVFSIEAKTNGDGKLTYKVSNKKIATVSKNGEVTIKSCGRTQIQINASASGNYSAATKNITLTVKPQKTTVTSIKSTKPKSLTLKWKRDKKAKGYMIQCSTDKNFKKNVMTVTVSKNSTISKTVTKLKAGKKYYVRICAYAASDGEKIKGNYSNVKTVKVKK